jgi:hypothetical protein
VLTAVVYGKVQSDKLGEHHRAAAPRLDGLLLACGLHLLDLAEKALLHIRSLLE